MTLNERIKKITTLAKYKRQFSVRELMDKYMFSIQDIHFLIRDGYLVRGLNANYFVTAKAIDYNRKKKMECLNSIIQEKKYGDALSIIENLKEDGTISLADYNFFLVLLSFVTDLPESTLEYVNILEKKDLEAISHPEFGPIINNILYAYNINSIFSNFRSSYDMNFNDDSYFRIVSTLLWNARKEYRDFERKLSICIENRDYQEAICLLDTRNRGEKANLNAKTLITILKIHEAVKRFQVMPKVIEGDYNSLYDKIMAGYFGESLNTIERTNNLNLNSSYINVEQVLKDLVTFLTELERRALDDHELLIQLSVKGLCTFLDVVNSLEQGKVSEGTSILKNYLRSIDKEEYAKFMMEEIKRSIIQKDETFYIPLKTLAILENSSISMDKLISSLEKKPTSKKTYVYKPVKR